MQSIGFKKRGLKGLSYIGTPLYAVLLRITHTVLYLRMKTEISTGHNMHGPIFSRHILQ
jgi:hypothetical protein